MLPLTVSRTYLAFMEEKVYFSELAVVPLLSPLKTLVNVLPSRDVAMTKLLLCKRKRQGKI